MAEIIDRVEFSGIVKVRDAILKLDKPYRLESGEPSFDVPQHIKEAIVQALRDNHTHYVASAGIAPLRNAIVKKANETNAIPVKNPNEVIVTNGGMHALYVIFRSLLEAGDEVLIPDPTWTCVQELIKLAGGVVKRVPLHEELGWRFDPDELRAAISDKTRAFMLNSPHNPTGGVLHRADLEQIAAIVSEHPHLAVVSDEAYEHVIYDGIEHVSLASLPGMYRQVISVFTMSKSYAMTGLRLGYILTPDLLLMDRMAKVVLYTSNGVSSITQYGGVAALTGPQDCVAEFRTEYQARRDLFYEGIASIPTLRGKRPDGAFYAFVKVADGWQAPDGRSDSWAMTEYLLKARVGSSPGVIFGPQGEGYVRFSTACVRSDLTGALDTMRELFAG